MHEWFQSSVFGFYFIGICALLYILQYEKEIRVNIQWYNVSKIDNILGDINGTDRRTSVHKLHDWYDISDKHRSIDNLFPSVDDDNDIDKWSSGSGDKEIDCDSD